ncbi:MAG: hypothetical protein ACE5DU_03655 [Nitrosopumilus sp.]
MAEPGFGWIYLVIFLAIPLARIIPRLLAKRKGEHNQFQRVQENQFQRGFDENSQKPQTEYSKPQVNPSKPQTKSMLVLGELNGGTKTFENIQKNTGIDNKDLDSILEELEKNGMLKVHQKQGLFGLKTELLPTDKGFKEYYS